MPSINFYHLTHSSLEAALFQLLSKAHAGGHRAVVRFANDEDAEAYDTALWVRNPDEFLPHGTTKSKFVKEEPILLTAGEENLNKADFAFVFPEASTRNIDYFERVFFLFDGTSDTQVKEARSRWKEFKSGGFELAYWTQGEDGKWSEKTPEK